MEYEIYCVRWELGMFLSYCGEMCNISLIFIISYISLSWSLKCQSELKCTIIYTNKYSISSNLYHYSSLSYLHDNHFNEEILPSAHYLLNLSVILYYKGYSESNLRWAVNKTSNEKNIYHIQKICTYFSYFSQ
jgi:hypothetical protein